MNTYRRDGNHIIVGEPRPLDPNANLDPGARVVMTELKAALNDLAELRCTDGSCALGGPAKGMHTNGGCKCLGEIRNPSVRARVRRVLDLARKCS